MCQLVARARAGKPQAEPFSLVRALRMTVHGMVVNTTLYHIFMTNLNAGRIWGIPMPGAMRR